MDGGGNALGGYLLLSAVSRRTYEVYPDNMTSPFPGQDHLLIYYYNFRTMSIPSQGTTQDICQELRLY